ncbi:prefoldin subunit alpha [Candidatus Pacearchaeota archaeon]|nr:prefoldin subunit alpha [Candidatus Pacearchaeota archaeon]
MESKEQQELMFKLSMFEQQMQEIQQQLQAVEQGIAEMSSLSVGLDELVGSEGKEILAPVGRGIFIRTKLLSEKLTVDVGGKTFIKKSIPDTKKIIEDQIGKLEEVQKDLKEKLEKIGAEFQGMIMQAQGHVCEEGCECGKD